MAGLNVGIESNMCDDSGTTYGGDDDQVIVIDLDDMDLSDLGLDGLHGTISLTPKDLDEQTKRELFGNGSPDPKCRWCKGTGKVRLLVSESNCDCVTKRA